MRKEQRLTLALGVTCALLAALAVAQRFGVGSGYSLLSELPPPEARPGNSAPKAESQKLPVWPEYADLINRPMFNEDRKPTPVSDASSKDDKPVQPLNVALTGIIMTPNVKLAMIRDNASGKSMRLKPGMPLIGDQSAWKVVEVRPRSAVLEATGSGQQEIRLQVNDKAAPMMAAVPGIAPGVPPPAGSPPTPAPEVQFGPGPTTPAPNLGGAQAQPAASANADEIRRRIEERRKQLREEAQRMSSQDAQKQ